MRTSKARKEQGKPQVKMCAEPALHVRHLHIVSEQMPAPLSRANELITYECPGVGATLICTACDTLNLIDQTHCTDCGLRL